MPFGSEFGEKLTHTLVATAIGCGTAAIAMPAGIGVIGVVEAVLGAAAVGRIVLKWRATRADALLRRCTAAVARGSDALLDDEYRRDPDVSARRDAAVAAIRDVLPRIVPQAGELVAARLTSDRVVAYYLDRAATARPAVFGAMAPDDIPRRLLHDVIDSAWKLVLRQPEFRDDVLFEMVREVLPLLDDIRLALDGLARAQRTILDRVEAVPAATAEQVMAALEAGGYLRKADAAGLEREAMLGFARRLKPYELLNFDQAVVEVGHAIDIAVGVIARGERGGNLDAFVEDVLRRLAETTRASDPNRGARVVDDALRELDVREAEQRDSMRRSRTALLEAGIEQDTLRRDADGVARRIEALVAVEHPAERPAWTPAFRERRDALHDEGRDKGINFSLEVAAALARRMLDTARDSDERGDAGNLLGNALATLGERESGTTRLEQAVDAYRAALEERTRERVPLDWAGTQNNLGNALETLGARESGTTRLEQAVDAYRAALEERTRERVPLDWAMTQNNLGNALQALGGRESGTTRLEQAVEAFRAALLEYTRERVPLDWAMTQNNLGSALATLGGRESGTARLEQAVDAYRAALEERTRERVPLDWAMTQNNLGNALQALGGRESGTTRLEQAVEAFRAALEERTRERVPLNWAMTQNNLGNALAALGGRESGTTRLEQAVEAFRAALEERTRERVPLNWAMTQNNLGNALAALGGRESGTTRLEQAVDAYRAALEERTRERVPLDWAFSQHGLAEALAALATRLRDPVRLAEALGCMRDAAEVYRQGGNTYWLPIAERRIGEIEAALAALRP